MPFLSSSSARFAGIATAMKFPDATGVIVWGPGPLEPHHYLDLSWYAIHPIELLYTLMGSGCEVVSRMATVDSDAITGRWKGGRRPAHAPALRVGVAGIQGKLTNPD